MLIIWSSLWCCEVRGSGHCCFATCCLLYSFQFVQVPIPAPHDSELKPVTVSSFSLPGTGLGISMWPSAGQWYERGSLLGVREGSPSWKSFLPFFQETHRKKQLLFFFSMSGLGVTVRRGSLKISQLNIMEEKDGKNSHPINQSWSCPTAQLFPESKLSFFHLLVSLLPFLHQENWDS